MKIQLSTDKSIEGSADLIERTEVDLADALARFERRLTRIEVHLREESAGEGRIDTQLIAAPATRGVLPEASPPVEELNARVSGTLGHGGRVRVAPAADVVDHPAAAILRY